MPGRDKFKRAASDMMSLLELKLRPFLASRTWKDANNQHGRVQVHKKVPEGSDR